MIEANRRQGIATMLLHEAIAIAERMDKKELVVFPKPIGVNLSKEELTKWYLARGFKQWDREKGHLVIEVSSLTS